MSEGKRKSDKPPEKSDTGAIVQQPVALSDQLLPVGWVSAKIQDVCTFFTGGDSFRKLEYTDHGIPVLTKGDVKPYGYISHSRRFAPESYSFEKGYYLSEPGDLLLTTRDLTQAADFLGLVAPIPEDKRYFVNQGANIIRLDEKKVLRRFFIYWCNGPMYRTYIKTHYVGSTQIHLRKEDFLRAPIWLPPRDVQESIAHILGTLDDKIELNRKMNRTLEAIARAIFKSWFVDFDPVIDNALAAGKPIPEEFAERAARRAQLTHGKSSLPEDIRCLFPDEFQDSELGPIPRGWEVGTLGGLCEKPQYGYTESAKVGPRFLRIKDINKQPWIEWETVPYCEIDQARYEKYKLASGDIVVARIADPGHAAYVEENVKAVFASYLIRFRPTDTRYGRYIQYWQQSLAYWDLVRGRRSGSTRGNLNAKVLRGFPLLIPPVQVAERFAESVGPLRVLVQRNLDESFVLAQTRDTLLPALLGGQFLARLERQKRRCDE